MCDIGLLPWGHNLTLVDDILSWDSAVGFVEVEVEQGKGLWKYFQIEMIRLVLAYLSLCYKDTKGKFKQ